MKASEQNSKVVEVLNDVLSAELTAINQYFLHSEMCHDWGYNRLHHIMRGHSIDEMKHAESLIERILYIKGVPNVQRMGKINIGETVPEQFESDYKLEKEAIERLNKGVETAREAGDNGSRLLLEEILKHEEDHMDWLESQRELLEQVGEQAYLAEQINK